MLALTETRLQSDMPAAVKLDAAPPGYTIRHVHRSPTARHPFGGSIAVIHRDNLTVSAHPLSGSFRPSSFELQLVRLAAAVPPLAVAVVYRPPDGSKVAFLDELSEFLFQLASTSTDRILLCGDLNCPGPEST